MKLFGWTEYVALAYLPIILVGLVGNILSLYVYTRPRMRKSTVAFLLYSLSISDIFVLLFALPIYSVSHLSVWDDPYIRFSTRRALISFSTKYFYPLCMTAKTVSLYIMVLITVERWIAVCRPLQVHIWCTFRNSVKSIVAIIIFSLILNISKFWEYEIMYSKTSGYYLTTGLLDPENHWWYFLTYFIILSVIFDYLLPFIIMVIANIKVINELRRTRKQRSFLTTTLQKEQNTTVMLLVITILFAFCHFFAMGLKIAESIFGGFLTAQSEYFEIIGDIFNLLIVIHIGTTFFIYYFFSSRFRNSIKNLFGNMDAPNYSESNVYKRRFLSTSQPATFLKISTDNLRNN